MTPHGPGDLGHTGSGAGPGEGPVVYEKTPGGYRLIDAPPVVRVSAAIVHAAAVNEGIMLDPWITASGEDPGDRVVFSFESGLRVVYLIESNDRQTAVLRRPD